MTSGSERLKEIRRVFLDLDGTLYRGQTVYPTSVPFLEFLRGRGIGYTFLTNNSSCSATEYLNKLESMGLPCPEGGRNLYTSTGYAIDYLRRNRPELKRIYLFGMPSIRPEFEAAGFELTDAEPQAVVIAFHRAFCYEELCRAAWHLSQGAPGFATHPDLFCPTDQQTRLPDCGAVTLCLEAAAGCRVTVLGKPNPEMLVLAARAAGVEPARCLMVGDRLATDIALGVRAGAMTCRIADDSAEHQPNRDFAPDLTVANLGELQRIWENV